MFGAFAGHHCSWCFSPAGVRYKMIASLYHDGPRYADMPGKTDLAYLHKTIRDGERVPLNKSG